ncbi:MAG: hypothetical protein OEO20_10990 [Gemmatimonadota bacterium]|nr:hypothetical protein [Gemmatimonadota bacterium]MDH3368918.1 hypothetical protein [Gemmatimonadota bacterium]MDH3478818.1 hypothetical protein [Gemmatimonadota bacterium]MDH3571448.1 hypothetical protein [Gemmatimonadota bacterium]MDH5550059.1 hypothetical protein [Gemmatimonadota bacterium]
MRVLTLTLLGGLLGCMRAGADGRASDPCESFYVALEAVPHDSLVRRAGEFESLWDRKTYRGCEIRFVAHDSLTAGHQVPDFDALEGSEMYRLGWRMTDGIGADGPGSGIFGIERNSVQCVVRWEQPAYIDDDGEFVQSDTLSMTVQCRELPSDP